MHSSSQRNARATLQRVLHDRQRFQIARGAERYSDRHNVGVRSVTGVGDKTQRNLIERRERLQGRKICQGRQAIVHHQRQIEFEASWPPFCEM